MKLTRQSTSDNQPNGIAYTPDLQHSPTCAKNPAVKYCCSQLDNRIRELEREMTNLRLHHLESHLNSLKQQNSYTAQNGLNFNHFDHIQRSQNQLFTPPLPVHSVPPQHILHSRISAKYTTTTTIVYV